MNQETLWLRIFAGQMALTKAHLSPSTAQLLEIFVNPDEIDLQIRKYDFLERAIARNLQKQKLLTFFNQSTLLKKQIC